jgi:hypothetical protein
MSRFDAYRDSFANARLSRSPTGVLEVALHTDGGTLVFNGHTHEQFVDLFHAIGSDSDNRVVILTGSGDAFMERITLDGFDFFTPRGYDKIYREGKKVLMNLLDIEVPLIRHRVRRRRPPALAGSDRHDSRPLLHPHSPRARCRDGQSVGSGQ